VEAEGETKVQALNTELRAVNQGTLSEFEQYQAKVEALREQLVATDNEKCEARTRAATLERECKQLQEQMWEVKNKAACQAATVANMLSDLEAREAQCEADFAKLRSMNDTLQDREHDLMREQMKAGSGGSGGGSSTGGGVAAGSAINAVGSRRPGSGSGSSRSGSRERGRSGGAGGGGGGGRPRSGLGSRERERQKGAQAASRSGPLTTASSGGGSGRISRR
jgi:hypothetical protein